MTSEEANIIVMLSKAIERMAIALEEHNELYRDEMVAEVEFVPDFEVDKDLN